MDEVLVKVNNVSKKFCRDLKRSLWYGVQDLGCELIGLKSSSDGELRKNEFWAVKNAGFELKRGECLGLIGRNGAGKTTLLRMLNGLIKPDGGRIEIRGRVGALIALGAGFNPVLTGRENIYVNASILGLTKKEIDSRFDEIVEFAELGEFIDTPVQSYSSGMQVRLGFAVATSLEPDVLLLDEILAVGDAAFKMKAYARIGTILQNAAVIFVTHSMTQLYRVCDVVGVMNKGVLKVHDSINDAVDQYMEVSEVGNVKAMEMSHECVTGFDYSFSSKVNGREGWDLSILVALNVDMPVGLVIVNFTNQEGMLVAEYRQTAGRDVELKPGKKNKIHIRLDSLPLKNGKYGLDFALYTQSRKQAVVHVSGAGPVQVVSEELTEAVCALNGKFTVSDETVPGSSLAATTEK